MNKSDYHRQAADGIDALEDAGFDVYEAVTTGIPVADSQLAEMFGAGRRTEEKLVFIVDPKTDAPEQEHPDDDDPDDDEAVHIGFEDNPPKPEGQQTDSADS